MIVCKLREAESSMVTKQLQNELFEIQRLWQVWPTDCVIIIIGPRGVRLAKNDFGSVLQKNRFSVRFRFYKINCGFSFSVCFSCTVCCLMCMHFTGILLFWIDPTNCQPKWLRTRSPEIRHEEKYFDCWSYHVGRWIVNETMWKTVPKPPKLVFQNWTAEAEFSVFEFWGQFGSVWFLENRYPTFSSGSAHP